VDASLIVADANKQRSTPGSQWNRELDAQTVSRAMQEYLATLDDAAFGAASDVRPKFVSPSDPAAQWTGAMRGPAFFAYSDNYLIDVKFGIIMDVEASRAIRQAEVSAAKTMIERTEQRFDIKPERLAGDTAYGSGANLNWLVNEAKIAPHIPVVDKSKREDGTFSREDFSFDKEQNVYICPAGKVLTTTGKLFNDGETLYYRAKTRDCRSCILKAQCCREAREESLSSFVQDLGGPMGGSSASRSAPSVRSPGSRASAGLTRGPGAASSVASAAVDSLPGSGAAAVARADGSGVLVSLAFGWRSLRSTAAASCAER